MDNETRRPRKRVTKKMAQRRRMVALAVIILLLILGIILICKACSSDDSDAKGNKNPKPAATTTSSITTTDPNSTPIVPTTTTTAPVPTADPNDPNTITGLTLDRYSVSLEIGESEMPWVTMSPSTSTEKGEIWESSDTAVATVDHIGNITAVGAGECIVTVTSENNPVIFAQVKVTVIDPNGTVNGGTSASTTAPSAGNSGIQTPTGTATSPLSFGGTPTITTENGMTYVNGILIANKSYELPPDYNPGGLTSETQSSFDEMAAAASKEGLSLRVYSGFRSYDYQSQIYNNYVDSYGASTADTFSARPGHSEHQTGLAIDVNCADDSFEGTPEAKWLAENCYKYGFIIRYPKGKDNITGYKYEPWHVRYLGVDNATAVYNSGLTLEEYLGIDSVYH